MLRLALLALAVIAACKSSDRDARESGGAAGAVRGATGGSHVDAHARSRVVPALPRSEDGVAALASLDATIALLGASPAAPHDRARLAALLLERTWIRGDLDDYVRAHAESAQLVRQRPRDPEAWRLRVHVLTRMHLFDDAHAALRELARHGDPEVVDELSIAIEQATAVTTEDLAKVLAVRADHAARRPSGQELTLYAVTLAEAGKHAEAIAVIPRAASALRSNTAVHLAWLLFQWGRIHELAGNAAAARELFAEAHHRLPAHVETIEHLVEALAATGEREEAAALALAAVRGHHAHPSLRALAVRHANSSDDVAAIVGAWDRYVEALPGAFAEHAARSVLGLGTEPGRALAFARRAFADRPRAAARTLVIEAALAASEHEVACTHAEPLHDGTRRERFLAWQAYTQCGREREARRLATELGLAPADGSGGR
jgi:tetratricopeptide (TPR) repeat protein